MAALVNAVRSFSAFRAWERVVFNLKIFFQAESHD